MTTMETGIDAHIPLVDLHRHLEGSVRIATVIDVSRKYHLDLPTINPDELKAKIFITHPVTDILEFFPRVNLLRQIFVRYEVCRRVVEEFFEDAKKEGLDYIELRFSPLFMAEPGGLNPHKITAEVCNACREAGEYYNLEYGVIVIMSRDYGAEQCKVELQAAIDNIKNGVVALDLAGDEARYPATMFTPHYKKAGSAGLHLIAHAGEFAGAESVMDAINILKVERIGHGVRAADSPDAIKLIRDNNIFIESCLTSNYLTSSVRDIHSHPIRQFLRNGLLATINTDDPALFQSITIKDEYKKAKEVVGLESKELQEIQRNGIFGSFNYSKKGL